MREALLKMDRLARRHVILYWFAGVPSWERMRVELYPRIFGRDHVCYPMGIVLYNLLYSLGIYVDVKVVQRTAFSREYEGMEEGISELRRALRLSTQKHDGAIRAYLERWGRREGERVILEDDTVYMRMSWRGR